jgi:hypothetical protein
MYQTRKVSGHVCLSILPLCTIFDYILELFRQFGIFFSVFSSLIFEYNNTFVFYFSVFNFPLIFEYNNTYVLLSSCTIVVYGEDLLYVDTKVTCLDL